MPKTHHEAAAAMVRSAPRGNRMSGIPDDSNPASHARKILIVEDSFANRDMLTRRLQRRGFAVCGAADGSTGVAMSVSEMPDLILMDTAHQGRRQDRSDSRHRLDSARAGERPGEKCRGGLRRLRHQAGRSDPAAGEDRALFDESGCGSCPIEQR
jgi:hypothetical protein